MIDSVKKKFGLQSKEMTGLWNTIREKDSINLIKVKRILDGRGWLGSDVIGRKGSSTLFLVIQHADKETQEKYIPMLREAVKQGKAEASSLALMEDRLRLRQGRRQIYGSQIGGNEKGEKYVLPLIDPDRVNERRKEVGLGPIEDYTKHFGFEWDLEKYKKELPQLMLNEGISE